MTREEVSAKLTSQRQKLRDEFAVETLLLFGSVARNEASVTSDVDVLVTFSRPTGYFGIVRLQSFLEQLLGCGVDVGTAASLRPAIRHRVEREAIRVA